MILTHLQKLTEYEPIEEYGPLWGHKKQQYEYNNTSSVPGLSVTIHAISTSWKKILDGGPYMYYLN